MGKGWSYILRCNRLIDYIEIEDDDDDDDGDDDNDDDDDDDDDQVERPSNDGSSFEVASAAALVDSGRERHLEKDLKN